MLNVEFEHVPRSCGKLKEREKESVLHKGNACAAWGKKDEGVRKISSPELSILNYGIVHLVPNLE